MQPSVMTVTLYVAGCLSLPSCSTGIHPGLLHASRSLQPRDMHGSIPLPHTRSCHAPLAFTSMSPRRTSSMQSRDEIQRVARYEGVPTTTIEKDMLLDVMLDEIARAPYGAGTLYFKGGTAIRKLFIPGYRYSEYLDFTFEGSWNMATLRHWLADVAAAMEQTTGQSRRSLTVRETRNVVGEEALDAHLIVSSRLSSTLTQRIKFDITHFEHVLDRIQAPLSSGVLLPAYSLEEIVAEKTRSLFQRICWEQNPGAERCLDAIKDV